MWRASLRQRLAVLIICLALAYLFTLYKVAPGPADGYDSVDVGSPWDDLRFADNLARFLDARHGFELAPGELKLVRKEEPGLLGYEVAGWFEASVDGQTDIFVVHARLSPRGIPLSVDRPRNISQTPDGDERILGLQGRQIVLGASHNGQIAGLSILDFSRTTLRAPVEMVAEAMQGLNAREQYGEWEGPARIEALLTPTVPAEAVTIDGSSIRVHDGQSHAILDLRTGQSSDPRRIVVLPDTLTSSDGEATIEGFLRRDSLVGPGPLKSLRMIWANTQDLLRVQRHRLAPTAADRAGVADRGSIPQPVRLWPPSDLASGGRRMLAGEGEWAPAVSFAGEAVPSVMRTFLRTNPERPYERVHLFALDSRRLGLGYSAGAKYPPSTTGIRGTGMVPHGRRALVVGLLNGGVGSETAPGGVVELRREIRPPSQGLATVALKADGASSFGLWDVDGTAFDYEAIRQSLPPLVAGGELRLGGDARWAGDAAGFDELHIRRAALGTTSTGSLLYAWSDSTTARALGEAMVRAGVEFAMHLTLGQQPSGLTFYPEGGAGAPVSGMAGMPVLSKGIAEPSENDFFYLFRRSRLSQFVDSTQNLVNWRIRQRLEGVPVVAEADAVVDTNTVRLLILDGSRLRPHMLPGFGETRPAGRKRIDNLTLPSAPLAWLGVGLRHANSPAGLTVERQVWKRPQNGLMTLVVDAGGNTRVGRYGTEPVESTVRWSTLLQGPSVLRGGQPSDAASGVSGVPLVAFGLVESGLLAFAVSETGSRPALASSLQMLGVKDALLLGEQGTVDTGDARYYFEKEGDLVMTVGGRETLSAAKITPGAASALVFTARAPLPSSDAVDTFRSP